MNTFNAVVTNIILVVLALSTILLVVEAAGFLPEPLLRHIKRRRAIEALHILEEMGLDTEAIRHRINPAPNLGFSTNPNYVTECQQGLKAYTMKQPVNIGRISHSHFQEFIDLMGATTQPEIAEKFARMLSTHYRQLEQNRQFQSPHFDFVVCCKEGSPILAYEFSKLVNKPLILHSTNPKFHSGTQEFCANFDAMAVPTASAIGLIVDDSTTGGRKVLEAAKALRRFGYKVEDCLIVFEPMGKNARQRLEQEGIKLHSIIEGPKGSVVTSAPTAPARIDPPR